MSNLIIKTIHLSMFCSGKQQNRKNAFRDFCNMRQRSVKVTFEDTFCYLPCWNTMYEEPVFLEFRMMFSYCVFEMDLVMVDTFAGWECAVSHYDTREENVWLTYGFDSLSRRRSLLKIECRILRWLQRLPHEDVITECKKWSALRS